MGITFSKMMNFFELHGTEATEKLGARLAKRLLSENRKSAFIAMRGEMGVGKTAFTRGFARELGIEGVKSPTYSILNEYRGKVPVYHFDMYRIESEDDLYSIGYDDYLMRDGYIVCEWSENIDAEIPENAIFVEIRKSEKGENVRLVTITGLSGGETL